MATNAKYSAFFSKGLQHNSYGEVIEAEFEAFEAACKQPNFVQNVGKAFEDLAPVTDADRLANPLAAWATGDLGPVDFSQIQLRKPPAVTSKAIAAEMTELYWMALLRDVGFSDWPTNNQIQQAATEIDNLVKSSEAGVLTRGVGQDFPNEVTAQTIFRGTGPGENEGPLVSQFWLHNTPYGTQTIPAAMLVYDEGQDYLTSFDDWLHAQNTGRSNKEPPDFPAGRTYEQANRGADDTKRRRIVRTMRDFASFVHRDALHQAYFNAALQLLAMTGTGKVRTSSLDPYNGALSPTAYKRMKAFGTFGGPHLLSLVSEVAARALQLQWHQKWRVHRRLRPEAFGGLAHMQFVGNAGTTRNYDLAQSVSQSAAAGIIQAKYNGLLLPVAYQSGSPTHPAYGAGHATVAGACVTILKAWFHEDDAFLDPRLPPDDNITDPKLLKNYPGELKIGHELNKLASNVAMGRSMGGVHFRTDNMRSLRIGEMLAIVVLGKSLGHFAERRVGKHLAFGFTSFRDQPVFIYLDDHRKPVVEINGTVDQEYSKFFNDHDIAELIA